MKICHQCQLNLIEIYRGEGSLTSQDYSNLHCFIEKEASPSPSEILFEGKKISGEKLAQISEICDEIGAKNLNVSMENVVNLNFSAMIALGLL